MLSSSWPTGSVGPETGCRVWPVIVGGAGKGGGEEERAGVN